MANGVTPVEPNPTFLEDVRKAADGKGVILACEGGGTTEPTPSFQWVSRAKTLAYGDSFASCSAQLMQSCNPSRFLACRESRRAV